MDDRSSLDFATGSFSALRRIPFVCLSAYGSDACGYSSKKSIGSGLLRKGKGEEEDEDWGFLWRLLPILFTTYEYRISLLACVSVMRPGISAVSLGVWKRRGSSQMGSDGLI